MARRVATPPNADPPRSSAPAFSNSRRWLLQAIAVKVPEFAERFYPGAPFLARMRMRGWITGAASCDSGSSRTDRVLALSGIDSDRARRERAVVAVRSL